MVPKKNEVGARGPMLGTRLVSINKITTRASREMTSRKNKNIILFYFNGVNVAKHWHMAGEVFAISDCLVVISIEVFVPERAQICSASRRRSSKRIPVEDLVIMDTPHPGYHKMRPSGAWGVVVINDPLPYRNKSE